MSDETLQGRPAPDDERGEGLLDAGLTSQASGRSLVLMRVQGAWLGASAEQVDRIADEAPVTALPRAPAHLEGLMLIGARAIPVVDLTTLLGLVGEEEVDEDRPARVVVLRQAELRAAIRCSHVRVVRDLPESRFGPVVVAQGAELRRFAASEVEIDDEMAVVLDLALMLEAARVRRT